MWVVSCCLGLFGVYCLQVNVLSDCETEYIYIYVYRLLLPVCMFVCLCVYVSVSVGLCVGFAINVVALLPYLAEHYDEPSSSCIDAAVSIADVSSLFTLLTLGHCQFILNLVVVCLHAAPLVQQVKFT